MNTIIYKGVIITIENGYYKFVLNGTKYSNTNIHMAKRMVTRELKN